MYNAKLPNNFDLPSSARLFRSTVIAAAAAAALLVTVVMPSEYGLDPTGVGRILGLTEMGEIKQQLAREAAADAASQAVVQPQGIESDELPVSAVGAWQDEITITLTPGQGVEYKLVMAAGAEAEFEWSANGDVLNFDTHGDGPGNSISYEKGRGVATDSGVLRAAFDGNHGWFWRNRTNNNVTLTLRTRGDYSELKRTA